MNFLATLAEKNKAIESLKGEMGGLRRSLDDVTGLEESLRQANETLREKATQIAQLQETVQDNESAIAVLTSQCAELEQERASLTSQLQTAESKALESDGDWKEKYTAEKAKLKTLSDKLSSLEVELGLMRAERDRASTDSQTGSGGAAGGSSTAQQVKELKEALTAEKDEHASAVSDLRQALTEKTAKLDKLQTELLKVRTNLEAEHKEQMELRKKAHSVESERHYLARKLQASREQCEESKAAASKLELRLLEASQRLKEAESGRRNLKVALSSSEEQSQETAKKVRLATAPF